MNTEDKTKKKVIDTDSSKFGTACKWIGGIITLLAFGLALWLRVSILPACLGIAIGIGILIWYGGSVIEKSRLKEEAGKEALSNLSTALTNFSNIMGRAADQNGTRIDVGITEDAFAQMREIMRRKQEDAEYDTDD